ncbi:MAG: extracellular solute-binding protein [Anaerolineae bacterium]|nr:extracellular solute-binding protein [Anaerolineae bacterium]
MSEEKILKQKLSRRDLLRKAALGGAGLMAAGAVAACATPTPQIIKETVIVEKPLEKVVKETVVVKEEVTKVVEKVATQIVEKPVEKVITATPAPRKAVEITYWQTPIFRMGKDNKTILGPGSDEWIKDAIDRFQKQYSWIKVKMEFIPWDQIGAKQSAAFANREVPNVFYFHPVFGAVAEKAQAGLFDPVDDYVTKEELSNWNPGSQEGMSTGGRLYGFPVFLSPCTNAISKTALEKNGGAELLDKIGPNRDGLTFDLMKEYGAKFSDGKTRWFLGVPTDHGSVTYWAVGTWLKGWGVRLWDEKQERWVAHENPNAVKAMQWYLDAQNDWKIMVPNLPKWSDVDNLVWGLNCAERFHTPGIQQELEVAQQAGQAPKEFQFVLTTFPRQPDVAPWSSGVTPFGYALGHETDPLKREAAGLFAKWLGTDDSNAMGWFVNGFFPVTKTGSAIAAKHEWAKDPNVQWSLTNYLVNFKAEAPGEGYLFWPANNPRTTGIFNKNFGWEWWVQQYQALLLGKKTAEQFVMEIGKAINTALGV